MASNGGWERRGFVRTIVAVGAVGSIAGCNSGDGGGEENTPTEEQTEAPAQTETTDQDGTDGEQDELGYDGSQDIDTAVEVGSENVDKAVQVANIVVEQMNHCGPSTELCLENTNERLMNVDPLEYVDPVEAETPEEARQEAARLREERDRLLEAIRTKVPREINIQAVDRVGIEIIDDEDKYQSPEDFREDAGDMPVDDAEVAMNDAADGMERIDEVLSKTADMLETAADNEESN